ncbi:MAG TPA: alpha-1,4-glucan--maltose-1-phosphate maltosyltransferase [Gemmatimonadaceae bacterium]|jgi:starch synthase (maltosyl-transferring)|nr:alpha-1,4-glucan--maltose-1-phosphate maltosyltransferase [Gemmatimonadaceae bacterium]
MPQRKTDRRSSPRRAEYVVIECVTPELDGGRHPVKRVIGDTVSVGADIIKEGHDLVGARLIHRGPGADDWSSSPLIYDYDADRWFGAFTVDRIGQWTFTVEAWTDHFGTWRSGLGKKVDAGQDVQLELQEGAQFARAASRSAKSAAAKASLLMTAKLLEDRRDTSMEKRIQRALDDDLLALIQDHYKPTDVTRYRHELPIYVDREAGRFSAWYEMFPRSATTIAPGEPPAHGTFNDAAAHLPRIAELGFDVVYLPPIHPIGHTFRKGKNNSLTPEPDDVGSPWAIGNENGGHDAIEPALGTIDDFDRFVETARGLGLEIALDYALQCSPDHPWVKEHRNWFHVRPDGSIQYAENPPKKYQDIYPINFWCDDRQALWRACRDVLLHWINHGVKIFRVDNPHTKAFPFWEWIIHEVQRDHPDVIFFAEAFTRPKRMRALAKLGFTMSYTYFTWKNAGWEIRDYLTELTSSPMVEYYRGNLFANTPDILNEFLVTGGRPAFRIRLLLAGTLLPLYGIYSGFELCENVPVQPGSEEYLDSEKYQLRPRDYNAHGNINKDIEALNRIRHEEPALHRYANLTFHTSENPAIVFYRKAPADPLVQWTGSQPTPVPPKVAQSLGLGLPTGAHDVLVVVTTDPHHVQETMVHVPIHEMGIDDEQPYVVHDLLTGARYTWRGVRNYVRIDPAVQPGHLFIVEEATRSALPNPVP